MDGIVSLVRKMLEVLLGGLFGPLIRMIPELLKYLDRKSEREHELRMQAANLEADKAKYSAQLGMAELETNAAQYTTAVNTLQEALRGQFQLTGNKWIDGLNMSVRPVITYSFFLLYALIKAQTLHDGGTLAQIWTETDMGLFSGILGFYFMGRVFDKLK
jgi:hypothetical protein